MWDGTKEAFRIFGTWMKEAPEMQTDWVKISETVPRNFSVDFGIQQKKAQKYMGKY